MVALRNNHDFLFIFYNNFTLCEIKLCRPKKFQDKAETVILINFYVKIRKWYMAK